MMCRAGRLEPSVMRKVQGEEGIDRPGTNLQSVPASERHAMSKVSASIIDVNEMLAGIGGVVDAELTHPQQERSQSQH